MSPCKTTYPDILATAYVKREKTLIAVASWASENVDVRLIVDWKSLGLKEENMIFKIPEINGYQHAAILNTKQSIPIDPGKGLLIEVVAVE